MHLNGTNKLILKTANTEFYVYRLLLEDSDRALERKVEVELWNVCFKGPISSLQSAIRRKASYELQGLLDWFLEFASGFYFEFLQEFHEKNYNLVSTMIVPEGLKILGGIETKVVNVFYNFGCSAVGISNVKC